GICYGMHWLAKEFGGTVETITDQSGFGVECIYRMIADPILSCVRDKESVLSSHGDTVTKLPAQFEQCAFTVSSKAIAAMRWFDRQIWGLQFHPEVPETPSGKNMLSCFVRCVCTCLNDWEPKNIIADIQHKTLAALGNHKAIIGFSGGVDSSTLAAILAPTLQDNLLAVTIDAGNLREGELKEIVETASFINVRHLIIDAAEQFQSVLSTLTEAELKRQAFSLMYRAILNGTAAAHGALDDNDRPLLIQGSLATDFIESGCKGAATVIKTHHNTFFGIHPLGELFKYEVRELARNLNLPVSISERQPFPGPGLFVRILGVPPTTELLEIVRWADAQVTKILKNHLIYDTLSQLVVALNGVKTVGVKGDARVYAYSIFVRAVTTLDFMTATGFQIRDNVRREITSAVVKHPAIVRVLYDETDKPPATTEFE
ncbi:MAG: 7-cyano-7-deazaguanine synthase, partial [bacterium]|nr:7-cyano-7-deazaguanine synthase [bacterium]